MILSSDPSRWGFFTQKRKGRSMSDKWQRTPETDRLVKLAKLYMDPDAHARFEKVALAGATAEQVHALATAPKPGGVKPGGDFEALVKAHLSGRPGTKKSAAMAAVRKDHPEAYRAWLAAQQR